MEKYRTDEHYGLTNRALLKQRTLVTDVVIDALIDEKMSRDGGCEGHLGDVLKVFGHLEGVLEDYRNQGKLHDISMTVEGDKVHFSEITLRAYDGDNLIISGIDPQPLYDALDDLGATSLVDFNDI